MRGNNRSQRRKQHGVFPSFMRTVPANELRQGIAERSSVFTCAKSVLRQCKNLCGSLAPRLMLIPQGLYELHKLSSPHEARKQEVLLQFLVIVLDEMQDYARRRVQNRGIKILLCVAQLPLIMFVDQQYPVEYSVFTHQILGWSDPRLRPSLLPALEQTLFAKGLRQSAAPRRKRDWIP